MTALLVSFVTFFSTYFGGVVALRLRKHLQPILGYTAGVLLGVVALDLLPEIVNLINQTGVNTLYPMVALLVGFIVFHIIEKSILIHSSGESKYQAHHHPHVGIAAAVTLVAHSFLDGVAIGVGFQANVPLGIAVAIAVIAHDFSDGLNTISLMLVNKNSEKVSRRMLLFDALAPIAGAASTLLFTLSDTVVLLYLGLFAGFLLYIATSQILPEAHSSRSSYRTIVFTLIGVVTMLVVTQVV